MSVVRVRLHVIGMVQGVGLAIMSVRDGLEFEAPIQSDTASLAQLVCELLDACPDVRALRDPTRGGLAATLNEIAAATQRGIEIVEQEIPVDPIVRSACKFLGLDLLLAANEGKLVAIVPADQAQRARSFINLKKVDSAFWHVERQSSAVSVTTPPQTNSSTIFCHSIFCPIGDLTKN